MKDAPTPAAPGRPKDLAKRKAILEAAKRLFVRNGYGNSSMDAIAAEAGVSKLTVYSHFTDKENLFAAAVKSKCEEQLPSLFFEFNQHSPIRDSLLAIGHGFHALVNSEESVAMHRLMVSQAQHNPKLSLLFYEAGPQRVVEALENLLRQANAAGSLRIADPARAAEHFLSLVKGAHNTRRLAGIDDPLPAEAVERQVQEVVALFMRAFRPDA
ncbi:MAG: TetR/AcrR family transcriptional regulator [Gammaproteobacteria bacterium]|nr:TetR/AcrR family transcriptional regulator [Gammaproteobacteria bacterium]